MDIWIPKLKDSEITTALREYYGFQNINWRHLSSFGDQNIYVTSAEKEYVLKIFSSRDDSSMCEAQYSLLEELAKNKLPAPRIIKNVNGQTCSWLQGTGLGDDGKQRTMRFPSHLQTYLSGTPLRSSVNEISDECFFELGRILGKFHVLLKDYNDPFFEGNVSKYWSLTRLLELQPLLDKLPEEVQPLVRDVLDVFKQMKIAKEETFPKGLIHGDPNDSNILISRNLTSNCSSPEDGVCGIFDFGETACDYYVYDLAICVASLCLRAGNCQRWNVVGKVVRGYSVERPLAREEVSVLKICICARYAQIIINSYYHLAQDPSNEHVKGSLSGMFTAMGLMFNMSDDTFFSYTDISIPCI